MSKPQEDNTATTQPKKHPSASEGNVGSVEDDAVSSSASAQSGADAQAESATVSDEAVIDTMVDEALEDVAVEGEVEQAEPSVAELTRLLTVAQEKAHEHQDQMMRAHAEMENLKRRHAQALEKAHKYALDKFINELLGVWDSLELGNAAAQDDSADVIKIREGTELTLKMLSGVMHKFGVEQHNPEGETFNPELHQAMSMQPRDDVEPNTVITVVQKGYSLNGRLLRPAMVMVSQAA